MVFGWLLSPSMPFYAIGSYFEHGFPKDQLVPVLTFGVVFLLCLVVVGRLMRVPVVMHILSRWVHDRVA
jgi:hypothetical protein